MEVPKEKLVRVFLFEEPHIVSFEYRKASFKDYKNALNQLFREKKIERVSKDSKTVVYKYKDQVSLNT